MHYLRHILFEMRHQKLMTWLSITGTTIAIFLIMTDFMITNLDSVDIVPETRRSRILYGFGGEVKKQNNTSSGALGYELAKELYSNLDGVELVSFSSADANLENMAIKGGVPESKEIRAVDENFWKIYDFNFEAGSPFTREEVEAGARNVILPRNMAEHFFGKQDFYLGREIIIDNKPFVVSGIVSDINHLLDQTHADAYISHVAGGLREFIWNDYLGSYMPIVLLDVDTHPDAVKAQVEKRYNAFNSRHESEELSLVYHEQPWTLTERHSGAGSNTTPSPSDYRKRYAAYAILLLIPAINLSSMTRSRMRRRISEIGLCRAFGCTRRRIITDLLAENLILTLIGGLIGLILSMIFITLFSNYFIAYAGWWTTSIDMKLARPSIEMLFSWKAFAAVLLFCLILNVLSAGIPVSKAAFINPAEAINGQNAHK